MEPLCCVFLLFSEAGLGKLHRSSLTFPVSQIDNKGNHLLVSEEASINVPAIAAAHVTKRYTAQATDELTFEVRASSRNIPEASECV